MIWRQGWFERLIAQSTPYCPLTTLGYPAGWVWTENDGWLWRWVGDKNLRRIRACADLARRVLFHSLRSAVDPARRRVTSNFEWLTKANLVSQIETCYADRKVVYSGAEFEGWSLVLGLFLRHFLRDVSPRYCLRKIIKFTPSLLFDSRTVLNSHITRLRSYRNASHIRKAQCGHSKSI